MSGWDWLVVLGLAGVVILGRLFDELRTLDRGEVELDGPISQRSIRAVPHYNDLDLAGQLEVDRRRARREP
jgi:hypothetical protein